MLENDTSEPEVGLTDYSPNRLSLNGRNRFIAFFALFNAILCLLIYVSLQNIELKEEKGHLESYVQHLVARQDQAEQEINQLKQDRGTAVVEHATEMAELRATVRQPATLALPTPYPTYTFYPTYTPEQGNTPTSPPPLVNSTDTPTSPSVNSTDTPTVAPPTPTTMSTVTATPLPPTTTPIPPTPTRSVPPTPTSENTHTPTSTPTSTATSTPTPTESPTAPAPVVLMVSPNRGETGSQIPVLEISGQHFQTGATARIDNGMSNTGFVSPVVVSSTLITGTLDLTATAGGPWDVIVTNPDLQTGVATNAFTVTIPLALMYGTTPTCSISVTNCSDVAGPPNNSVAMIQEGSVITLDMGAGNGIMNGRGYDMAVYEYDNQGTILLDWIIVELSEDQLHWHTVFNWGDGYQSRPACAGNPTVACDDATNIASFSMDGELDNEPISPSLLYNGTGILIDIDFLGELPATIYRYIRLSCPDDGPDGDAAQADSIQRLN
jgi:hypothetical protein